MKNKWLYIVIINIIILIMQLTLYLVIDVRLITANKESDKQEIARIQNNSNLVWYKEYLEKYKGEVDIKQISGEIYRLGKITIPKIYNCTKDLDDDKIREYFEQNKDVIRNDYLIEDKEEFVKLAKNINSIYKDKLKYNTAEFIISTYEEKGNYSKINLGITYSEFQIIFVRMGVILHKDDTGVDIFFESIGG